MARKSRAVRRHPPDHGIDVEVVEFFSKSGVKVQKFRIFNASKAKMGLPKQNSSRMPVRERFLNEIEPWFHDPIGPCQLRHTSRMRQLRCLRERSGVVLKWKPRKGLEVGQCRFSSIRRFVSILSEAGSRTIRGDPHSGLTSNQTLPEVMSIEGDQDAMLGSAGITLLSRWLSRRFIDFQNR